MAAAASAASSASASVASVASAAAAAAAAAAAVCLGCMFAYVLAAIFGGTPWKVMMGAAGIVAALQVRYKP